MKPLAVNEDGPPPLREITTGDVLDVDGQMNRGLFGDVSVSSGGTVEVDFADGTLQSLVLADDVADWVTTGRPDATGDGETRECRVLVDPGGVTRTLAFSSAWKWFSTEPASIADTAYGVLTLIATGPDEADVWAKWEVS